MPHSGHRAAGVATKSPFRLASLLGPLALAAGVLLAACGSPLNETRQPLTTGAGASAPGPEATPTQASSAAAREGIQSPSVMATPSRTPSIPDRIPAAESPTPALPGLQAAPTPQEPTDEGTSSLTAGGAQGPETADTPAAGYQGPGASSAERVDPAFEPSRVIRLLSFDDILPYYDPTFVPAPETQLEDEDMVLGLAVNGEARAYSVAVLNFREMVNDVVGGVPVLVTW